MTELGKIFLLVGTSIVILGLLLVFSQHIPFLGKLPGDITTKREGFTLYFPIVSFLIVSILLTILINVIWRFFGK